MQKTVMFEKIVGGGVALGYTDGKPCFAGGPLPGETAVVEVLKDKPHHMEAAVLELVRKAGSRTGRAEAHYLLCSPWQDVDYAYQLQLKREVLEETFGRPELKLPVLGMTAAAETLSYRNKLEFSLSKRDGGLDLAFHRRGSYEDVVALPEGCALGSKKMNEAALELAGRAHRLGLDDYMETLTVRRSVATGDLLGHIALHEAPRKLDYSGLADKTLAGVVVSQVRRRSDHELIWSNGVTSLVERLGGSDLEYPYDGFFQTNVTMFETILDAMLAAMPRGGRIIDIYGGVGTIGLAAAKFSREVVGVELNVSSVKLAEANAGRAGLTNYQSIGVSAGRIDPELLAGADCVVVDPPRAGLEVRLVRQLLAARPKKIVYLSCNPATQARDLVLLGEAYRAPGINGFDLYPGTLHLESLAVLELQ
jgi:23S rRNA (uracil1939-C5)-methyltransferase